VVLCILRSRGAIAIKLMHKVHPHLLSWLGDTHIRYIQLVDLFALHV